MVLLQILLAFVHMCVIPYLIGELLLSDGRRKAQTQTERAGVTWKMAAGLMVCYALFEVLTLFFQTLGKGFRFVCMIYLAIVLTLAVLGLITFIVDRQKDSFRIRPEKDAYQIAAFVLIAVQILAILFLATPDEDDAFYSGLSSMSLSYDYLLQYHAYSGLMNDVISARYRISALPVYQAALSLFSAGMHHLVICHNLFPLFYMPLSYALYYRIGRQMLEREGKEEANWKLLFCFALLHLIGNYYVFSPENFLVTRMWQGKALFVAIGIPFLWHFGLLALTSHKEREQTGKRERAIYWLLVMCGLIAVTFMGETGLFLGPFMLACQTLAACFVNKSMRGIVPAVLCCVPLFGIVACLLL